MVMALLHTLLMPEEKEIFFLKQLISLFPWHSQLAAEKGVRKAFVVLISQWGGTRSLLQATMALRIS